MKPIICYTMGKAGSSTVMNALKSVDVPVHRCHTENIDQYHYRDAPVITMVRDPIAWDIARSFETCLNTDQRYPDPVEYAEGMVEYFLKMGTPFSWFDDHIRPLTGVNIWGTERFRKSRGYVIVALRLLVMRTEKLDNILAQALSEYLPRYTGREFKPEEFSVEHRAKGVDRFGEEYEKFLDEFVLPQEFVADVYNTKYCRKFFLTSEMKEWYKKWTKS